MLMKFGWFDGKAPSPISVHTAGASRVSTSVRSSSLAFAAITPPPAYTKGRSASHRSEEHTSELQSLRHLVCRLLLGKKKRAHPIRAEGHTSGHQLLMHALLPLT